MAYELPAVFLQKVGVVCHFYASLAGMQYQVVEQEGFPQGADPYESIKRSCDYVKTMRPE